MAAALLGAISWNANFGKLSYLTTVRSITGEIGWRIVNDKTKVKREIESKGSGPSGSFEEKGETEDVFTCGAFGILGNKLNQRLGIVVFPDNKELED
ncbi:hypothetical protein N7536_000833 [Penicillium majusculum]|nr:hypothetical protein N7536_000833 [Penicillium majusculum]